MLILWADIAQIILGAITGLVTGGFALYQLGRQGVSIDEEIDNLKRSIEIAQDECTKIDYRLSLVEQKLLHKEELIEVQNKAQFYKLSKDIKLLKVALYDLEQFLSKHFHYSIRKVKKLDKDTEL